MSAINKQMNDYANTISPELYAAIPKAVFAAIAVSPVHNGAAQLKAGQTPDAYLLAEWTALYNNGLVRQKPYAPRTNKGAK